MTRILALAAIMIGICSPLFGAELGVSPIFSEQINESPGSTSFSPDIEPVIGDPNQRVLLATSVSDYPVTPGDVYRITYIRLSEIVSTEAIVNSDSTMNLNIFGVLKVDNLVYPQLRVKIEKLISAAYPDSRPQVMLQSTGIFRVIIKGEVRIAGFVQCWGLSRVSQVIRDRLTQYSSIRTISVISKDGKSKTCDIFTAARKGMIDQDPVVFPDDSIVVSRAERRAGISGSVYRPGSYELFEGENLNAIITKYSEGMIETADGSDILITRRLPIAKSPGEIFHIDTLAPSYRDFVLKDTDEVFVPSTFDKLPVVYFEGAIDLSSPDNDPLVKVTGRIGYRFIPGELLSSAVRNVKKSLSQLSLLEGAYVIREAEKRTIPINLEALLTGNPPIPDIPLVQGDRIVIPMRQFFVTVSGAVLLPGRYPYIPDRSYSFYINCAGGFDPEKNINSAILISDVHDQPQPVDRPIQPEDRIYAEFNNLGYYVGQWLPAAGIAVSVAALIVAIVQLLK